MVISKQCFSSKGLDFDDRINKLVRLRADLVNSEDPEKIKDTLFEIHNLSPDQSHAKVTFTFFAYRSFFWYIVTVFGELRVGFWIWKMYDPLYDPSRCTLFSCASARCVLAVCLFGVSFYLWTQFYVLLLHAITFRTVIFQADNLHSCHSPWFLVIFVILTFTCVRPGDSSSPVVCFMQLRRTSNFFLGGV